MQRDRDEGLLDPWILLRKIPLQSATDFKGVVKRVGLNNPFDFSQEVSLLSCQGVSSSYN